jgi:hypothetical protein
VYTKQYQQGLDLTGGEFLAAGLVDEDHFDASDLIQQPVRNHRPNCPS